ncbi:hypothetical protein [Verrucosispora sp. NA02020]|uniref:hypothetical protein n=1 Tax=Verrucosispora sp. NA02020 TaxID=2742132 RepID=UPI00159175D2|nr:hypothetical protein [Verrucosispora sp. NA02020]QKW15388.1 hypothetical protein HUT12_23220 [Verrucosispora sp. NA02020]
MKIRASRSAYIRGLRWESGGDVVSLTLDANDTAGTTRKDLIVLRMSRNPWTVEPAIVKGTAVANPTTPPPTYGEVTSTGVWELPLAEVTVTYNATVVNPAQCVPLAWFVGADGQYVCTPTTRPPHERGRRIFEYTTGREYMSTGSQWVLIASPPLETVANTTLSGWSTTTDSVVTVSGQTVDVRLGTWTRTGSSIASSADVRLPCTIPVAARHPSRDRRVTLSTTGGAAVRAVVYSAGATNAGQLWLVEHQGVSSGQTVRGADMFWTVP